MSQDLSNKILFLNAGERARLAAWLSRLERVEAINRGRWYQLCDGGEGGTDYISQRELAHLNDAIPRGFALDVIRGRIVFKK